MKSEYVSTRGPECGQRRPRALHRALRRGGYLQYSARNTAERGSVTAEYVIATLAAVSFAGLLVVILRGDEVRQILTEMVRSALSFGG